MGGECRVKCQSMRMLLVLLDMLEKGKAEHPSLFLSL